MRHLSRELRNRRRSPLPPLQARLPPRLRQTMASHERDLPRLVRPSLPSKGLETNPLRSRHQLVPQPSADGTLPQPEHPATDPTPSTSQAAVTSPPRNTSAQGSALPGGFPGEGREDDEMPALEDLD